ncbi:hypothetical protein CFC21_105331 [Triticum aestivum]|uniref:F-box domain-containing protein n=3 Tax=Triticum TaxID=4564 RepID=A0A9R1AB35_TRITD|nr:uncharacterized protein LOC119340382 [Triticum dicoccoides]XP_044435722.1 uncharacterized protein LOC123161984 [Triticum aestivum]XP_044435723.1 uncharacterized protein LOC123161984 [Triticum aestivum]KAF7104435.1 hypothetical protein CFC21_105331 [Triticum aestivum]VAI92916.1 unnamed protein product [Triticum turgidum subsp. durum]
MPDRRGATLLEDLPEEIINKILVLLGSKDVGRCRVVNTSWRSATSTPEFMLEHHRRQLSLPIVDGCGKPANYVVFGDAGAGASNQQLWPFLSSSKRRYWNQPRAVCDGFLIIYWGHKFYICNPVTRKHALLPQPQVGQGIHSTIVGFYQHHPTGEYRVLWVSRSQSQYSSESSLYVLTVGSDRPKFISVRMPTVSSSSTQQKLLNQLPSSSDCSSPVHHRGRLHWLPYDDSHITVGGGDIIVFDTETESFRWMCSPTQPCRYRKLFDMEGTLAWCGGSVSKSTSMDVWVMQDYKAEIWAFKYRIDVSTVEASRQLYLTSFRKKKSRPLESAVQLFNDMSVLNERELLIRFNHKHVLRCDIDGKFLGIVNIGKRQYRMCLTHHCLKESVVPIPGHEMQTDEEAPFFT